MPTLKQHLDAVLNRWPDSVSLKRAKIYDDGVHATFPELWKVWEDADRRAENEVENQLAWLVYQQLYARARKGWLKGERVLYKRMIVKAGVLGAFNPELKL